MLQRISVPTYDQVVCSLAPPPRFADDEGELALATFGRFASKGGFVFEQVSRWYSVHVVSRGRGVVEYDGVAHQCNKGSIFVFFPGQHLFYHDEAAHPWRYTWFAFSGRQCESLLSWAGFTRTRPVADGAFDARMEGLFREIDHAAASDGTGGLFPIIAGWRLIDAMAPKSAPQSVAESARHVIDHEYMSELNVEELASVVGVSRSTLFRQFRHQYGQSPKQYLDDVRLRKAMDLLRRTSSSIKEVARFAGFRDSNYFCRVFRKTTGLPPLLWKKAARPSAEIGEQ